jgi:hypothetical protein
MKPSGVGTRSAGRPQKSRDLAALVVKMAKDNPSWGYDRLEGVLKNLHHVIASDDHPQHPPPARARARPLRKPKISSRHQHSHLMGVTVKGSVHHRLVLPHTALARLVLRSLE